METEDASHTKRGLASASDETRLRVAKKGGVSPHNIRGLAAADPETRSRVAKAGGEARAQTSKVFELLEKKGGKQLKQNMVLIFISQ